MARFTKSNRTAAEDMATTTARRTGASVSGVVAVPRRDLENFIVHPTSG
ncbi:MAG: hypothetical protein AAGA06_00420 [Pseudomonadota bacterium]